MLAVLGDDLDRGAGGAAHAAALAGLQLDVVDDGAGRDLAELERVAGADVGAGAGGDRVADLHALRGEDVGLGAVGVVEQRDVGGAVRVVLDRRDLGGHAVLGPLEVDLAVLALGAAAAMARGDATVGVAASGALLALGQLLVRLRGRDLGAVLVGREAATGAGRLCLANRHQSLACSLRTARSGRRARARRSPSSRRGSCRGGGRGASACERTREVRTPTTSTPKISLDRVGDLGLVGAVVDAERVLALRHQRVALLGDDRLDDHLAGIHQASSPRRRRTAVDLGGAGLEHLEGVLGGDRSSGGR